MDLDADDTELSRTSILFAMPVQAVTIPRSCYASDGYISVSLLRFHDVRDCDSLAYRFDSQVTQHDAETALSDSAHAVWMPVSTPWGLIAAATPCTILSHNIKILSKAQSYPSKFRYSSDPPAWCPRAIE